jgi:hypothetical protein
MPLLRNYFTDERGIIYERTEDESSIEWRIANKYLVYTYKKPEKTWYSHHSKCPTVRQETDCQLEIQFKNSQVSVNRLYAIYDRFNSTTSIVRATSLKSAKRIFEVAKDTKDFWIQELASVDGEEGIIYD